MPRTRVVAAAIWTAVITAVVILGAALPGRFGLFGESRRTAGAERIRVSVLNATSTRGLARIATTHLRDRGFDVVYFGNAREPSDSTVIQFHTGRREWAAAAARAMGRTRVEEQPDSLRYLDLTVVIGADWTPPTQALGP